MIKIIKTKADHAQALEAVRTLIEKDPRAGTPEANELEVLSLLIENYEREHHNILPPTAVEAIHFRMDQEQLNPRDLIPYIGSRSKVSEILSGKRSLTMPMVRALHEGLGIPAEVLINQEESDVKLEDVSDSEWESFPCKEMVAHGFFQELLAGSLPSSAQMREFFRPMASIGPLYRRGAKTRAGRAMDQRALVAWTAQVINRARRIKIKTKFRPDALSLEALKEIAKLSVHENGPVRAVRHLESLGIAVIVEPHLSKTYLDGAAFTFEDRPIIGLTLRHDRLDNFWFSLLHETAHVWRHLPAGGQFFDDLDVDSEDIKEIEADRIASEALIPQKAWEKSPASKIRSPGAALFLSKSLGISPAIVAGRMRKEFNAYKLLNSLIGHGQVRKWFTDVNWGA